MHNIVFKIFVLLSGSVTPTNMHSPGGGDMSQQQHNRNQQQHSNTMQDYDQNGPNNKRPRISDSWAT